MAEPTSIEQAKSVEREIFTVFQEFDADRSGSIDAEELGQAMQKLGRCVNQVQFTLAEQSRRQLTGIRCVQESVRTGIAGVDFTDRHRRDWRGGYFGLFLSRGSICDCGNMG